MADMAIYLMRHAIPFSLLALSICFVGIQIRDFTNIQRAVPPTPQRNFATIKPFSPLPEVQEEPEKPKEIVPEFITVNEVQKRIQGNSIYADIINHAQKPVLEHERKINAHETTHMINAQIRNAHYPGHNGFYVTQGRGVVLKEPRISKSIVAGYVPATLRGPRFNLYLINQTEWNDTPTYILDEWVAYVNDARVGAEEKVADRTDAMFGTLEFSVYATALAMAVKERDPDYWKSNEQFRNFLIWHLHEAKKTFFEGRSTFPWAEQDKFLQSLRDDPQAEQLRAFLKQNLDGVWLE